MALFLTLIYWFLKIYQYIMIIYVLSTWFPNFRSTKAFGILGKIVEPYLSRFRRIIPPIGMIDISPIIGFLLLDFATRGFANLIVSGSF